MSIEKIRLVIMDVDGVLTDGKILIISGGLYVEPEIKAFCDKDGTGIKFLELAGIERAIITGRKSTAVKIRAKELGIKYVFQGVESKVASYNKLLAKLNLTDSEVCYIGDDILDVPLLKKAGFSVSVPDATEEVKKVADFITTKKGGEGAVREVVEKILKAQGKWEKVLQKYLGQI